ARALAACEGAGREVLAARLDALGAELGARRARVGELERGLAGLGEAERDGACALGVLGEPDAPWEALTPANARRLFGAVLERVVVDVEGGRAELVLALGGPLAESPARPAPAGPGPGGGA
ncbi:MAG TPA: hypothetical protein VFS00_04540, partial [Polyangiaceae bacterium]|nr:hypothetical protein [Polyangiaceae bacterium]